MNLTPKQSAFVDEYIVCRNGAEAARHAGYGVVSARVTASRLLTKANIKAALAVVLLTLIPLVASRFLTSREVNRCCCLMSMIFWRILGLKSLPKR